MSPSAQPVEQRQHAGAHRDVEHRDRLVGDEQLPARGRALAAIATRWRWPPESSCGIPVEEQLCRRELDAAERVATPAGAARSSAPSRRGSRSGSSTAARTRNRGSSDSYGSWKMIWIRAPERAQLARRRARVRSRPSKRIAPGHGIDQPQHGLRGRRLAAARLADEREHLARAAARARRPRPRARLRAAAG